MKESAPQGVTGVMELVRGYAIACLRANRDGSWDDRDAFWKEAMSAITALVRERDALRARVAEMEQDAARPIFTVVGWLLGAKGVFCDNPETAYDRAERGGKVIPVYTVLTVVKSS